MITLTASQGTHPLGGGSFGGTIVLSINGNVVKSFALAASSPTVSFYYNYLPTTTGSVPISATVTDSVLYQFTPPVVNLSTQYSAPPSTTTPSTNPTTTVGPTTPTTTVP